MPVPVLITQGDVAEFERLVVIARRDDLGPSGREALALAATLGARLAHGRRSVTVAPALAPIRALFADKQEMAWIEAADPIEWVGRGLGKGDLPFFVGIDAAREALRKIPALGEGRFLVAVPAREKILQDRTEPVAGPVIVGRSLAPRPA